MLPLLLHLLVICTSLLAWAMLTINGYFLFRRRCDPKARLLFVVIVALWGVTSLNAWYEGVINSWAFTFITPLFYLYYRFCITARYPDRRVWKQHLLLPALLAGFYLTLYLFSTPPDKLIYSWNQLPARDHLGWMVFRIGCYLSLAGQLFVYLPRLFGRKGVGGLRTPQALHLRREMRYVVYFCLLSVVTMFTPFQLSQLVYNLAVTALSGYIFSLLPTCRRLRQRLGGYLIPFDETHSTHGRWVAPSAQAEPSASAQPPHAPAVSVQPPEDSPFLFFFPPDLLHNPDLTIGMLARRLSTNETYLSRYFNRQLGVSFPEYVSACRLNEAEVLLTSSAHSVIAISEMVGFQTLSTFYQAFNARHQMPPSQWRKRCSPHGEVPLS